MSDLELGGTSHIHNYRWRRSLQCNLQLDRHDWHRAPTQDIGTLKSNQINGVLRTSILWGITQLGLLQIEDHGSHLNRHGRHINPLIAPPSPTAWAPRIRPVEVSKISLIVSLAAPNGSRYLLCVVSSCTSISFATQSSATTSIFVQTSNASNPLRVSESATRGSLRSEISPPRY